MFHDRVDAGRRLAAALAARGDLDVVLGLPRGGIPVGAQVAGVLGLPLDVLLVRKLGVPAQPELAFGAIGEGQVRVLDDNVVRLAGVTASQLELVERRERQELVRQALHYRSVRLEEPITGRAVVVVDDGIATGATARAACAVARAHGAIRVVVAVPVAAAGALDVLAGAADDVVALEVPQRFGSVGRWYADFRPTSADEVDSLLAAAAGPVPES